MTVIKHFASKQQNTNSLEVHRDGSQDRPYSKPWKSSKFERIQNIQNMFPVQIILIVENNRNRSEKSPNIY